MMAFSTAQWVVLGLVLVLGWLLGLLSRHGAGRYRRELAVEREKRIAAEKDRDARVAAANSRIAELERHAPPVTAAGTGGAIAAAARGGRDDLSLIRGIGRTGETKLNDLGIHRFRDISALSPSEEAGLESRLALDPGTIARERWREQADLLAANRLDEHRSRFG
jgi:predicted flap endonuclease-1-like 5' DNA nuclease